MSNRCTSNGLATMCTGPNAFSGLGVPDWLRGHDDDRNVLELRIGATQLHQRPAIQHGHPQVSDQDIRYAHAHPVECLGAVAGHMDLAAAFCQYVGND